MNKGFYRRLAVTNIRKNGKTYIPYILTCIVTVMMYYIIHSISVNKEVLTSSSVTEAMKLSVGVTSVFAVIFLFYTNSFLIKQRKKEIGLYNILGLEKRHISRMLGVETVIVAGISIGIGLAAGMIFSKLLFMLLLKIIHIPIKMGFAVELSSVISVLKLFVIIFLITYLCDLWQIKSTSPIELLHGSSMGEKEPKTKVLLTLIGLASLGSGYAIALLTESPMQALAYFFVAVILVIVGTYALFTAGSIAILKLLRKNKKFYYQTRHFTSVSGMMYRMKQNAAGLATICILSTVVLVMLSSTCSLYFGMKDVLYTRHPTEVKIENRAFTDISVERVQKESARIAEKHGLKIKDITGYREVYFPIRKETETGFDINLSEEVNPYMVVFQELYLIPVEDLAAMTGKDYTLNKDEIIFYTTKEKMYGKDEIKLNDQVLRIKEELAELPIAKKDGEALQENNYVFVADMETLYQLREQLAQAQSGSADLQALGGLDRELERYCYQYNLEGSEDNITKAETEMRQVFLENPDEKSYSILDLRTLSKPDFYGIYGSLLFIGIFLGILFIMATVLIIYYKQITEGYDDKERYNIMKKVGMSTLEIRQSIRSQILMVFFLPLLMAVIHIAVAFPVITTLLRLLNLTNVSLFLVTTICTVCIFAVMYGIVFAITAREYYRIVK